MRRLWQQCGVVGCGGVSRFPFCDAHHHLRRSRRRSGTPRRAGYDKEWKRFSAWFLKQNPRCVHCPEPATIVHHIDGKGPRGPKGYDPENLLPLCRSCHSTEHKGA